MGGSNGVGGIGSQQIQQVRINSTSPESASSKVGQLGSHSVKVASPSVNGKANLVQTKNELAASLGGRESAVDAFLQKAEVLRDYINTRLAERGRPGGFLSMQSNLSAAINNRADEWIDTMSALMDEGVSAEEIDRMSNETVSELFDLVDKSIGEAPKEVAREAPKEVAREAPKEVAQEAPKEVAQEAPKEVAQEAPKEVAQEAPKEAPREAPKEAAGGQADVSVKDLAQRKIAVVAHPEPQQVQQQPKATTRKTAATVRHEARMAKLQKGLAGLTKQIDIATSKMAAKLARKTAPKAEPKVEGWEVVGKDDVEKMQNDEAMEALQRQNEALKRQTEAIAQKASEAMESVRRQNAEVNKVLGRYTN